MLKLTLELKRVLKKSGTLWLNIGDSYASQGKVGGDIDYDVGMDYNRGRGRIELGSYREKCLCCIPERLMLRMIDEQAWILRNKIIWHKPNAMPASVRDRLKNSYEVVYLFVKNKKYWFDLDAIRVPAKRNQTPESYKKWMRRVKYFQNEDNPNPLMKERDLKQDNVPSEKANQYEGFNKTWRELQKNKYGDDPNNLARKQGFFNTAEATTNIAGANPGDVWTIATQPFKEAHFATFPEELVRRCIIAGCPKNGLVLDPFFGSGTVGVVAQRLGRNWLGIELKKEYIKMAYERIYKKSVPLTDF